MDKPKMRIYLDTSVFSRLFDDNVPQETIATWRLWAKCIREEFVVCISPLVTNELRKAKEPKRSQITKEMRNIQVKMLKATLELANLVTKLKDGGVLTEKHRADIEHLAYATANGCDALVSWNCKHLANEKTAKRMRQILKDGPYRSPILVTPATLLNMR